MPCPIYAAGRPIDHTDYSPACGACEGYGGIPTGDANDEITLTTCEIVAQPEEIDPSTLIKPIWGSKWTVPRYYEVDHRELARLAADSSTRRTTTDRILS
jgi:hypothetical protein